MTLRALILAAAGAATLGACGGNSLSLLPVERGDAAADAGPDCRSGRCPVDARPERPRGTGRRGEACAGSSTCASGFCFDGVCCDSDCSAACWSCAQPGTVGSCVPADLGTDPRQDCAEEDITTCGRDGVCDGSGSCRRHAAGAVCRASSCEGSTLTQAFRCTGAGACGLTSGLPCEPYLCDTDGARCRTVCTSSADCTPGRICIAGRCGRNPLGATCTVPEDCNSDFCQQGVCCATACTGGCRSCALAGSTGTCTQVPAGQDPLNQCADQTAASCGLNGSCNGAGACQLYPASTVCLPATCSASAFTPAGSCDGAGTCRAVPTTDCGRYLCIATGCRTSCVTAAECATGSVCILGTCQAPTNLELQYLCRAAGATEQSPKPQFQIINRAATPVPLTQVTIRYWFTIDGTQTQSAAIDYADVGGANVTSTFVRLPVAVPTADFYLELGFTAAAGSLAGNAGSSGQIQVRFNKADFSTYNQSNDYSFDATKATAFAAWNRVTVYRNGVLAWGIEPGVVAP